jgi:hypothetical protein
MKSPILALALGAVLSAAALPAHALILQGDRFVTAMKDNTVSGRTAAGTAYNLYFLPGGAVSTAMRPAIARAAAGGWTKSAISA